MKTGKSITPIYDDYNNKFADLLYDEGGELVVEFSTTHKFTKAELQGIIDIIDKAELDNKV